MAEASHPSEETPVSSPLSSDQDQTVDHKDNPKSNKQIQPKLPLATSVSSLGEACRICLSGINQRLVRVCDCRGSIGLVHDVCLNQWVNTSGQNRCQVCARVYQYEGVMYKPFKQWTIPKFNPTLLLAYILLGTLTFSCYYMLSLLQERQTIERIKDQQASLALEDYIRIVLTAVVSLCLIALAVDLVVTFVRGLRGYLEKQKMRRFRGANDYAKPAPPPSIGLPNDASACDENAQQQQDGQSADIQAPTKDPKQQGAPNPLPDTWFKPNDSQTPSPIPKDYNP